MYCPSCGEEIPDESAFCQYCGQEIGEESGAGGQPEEAETKTQSTLPESKLITEAIPTTIGLTYLAVGAATLYLGARAAPLFLIPGGVIVLPQVRRQLREVGVNLGVWRTTPIALFTALIGVLAAVSEIYIEQDTIFEEPIEWLMFGNNIYVAAGALVFLLVLAGLYIYIHRTYGPLPSLLPDLPAIPGLPGGGFEEIPEWIERYETSEEEIYRDELSEVNEELDELRAKKTKLEQKIGYVTKYKDILHADSSKLMELTKNLLRDMGLEVEMESVENYDGVLRLNGMNLVLKINGAHGKIDFVECRELRDWVETAEYGMPNPHGYEFKGLYIANPLRFVEPDNRDDYVEDSIVKFMEDKGHSIITAPDLHRLYIDFVEGELITEEVEDILMQDTAMIYPDQPIETTEKEEEEEKEEVEEEEVPAPPETREGFEELGYRELQKLAMQKDIKATQKKEDLIEQTADAYLEED